MKKILVLLMMLLILGGCEGTLGTNNSNDKKYIEYCEVLSSNTDFKDKSEFFDVSSDITKIDDVYRYYIIVDNVKLALFNIKAISLEKGVDYMANMAANIGIFEDSSYSLIPGQTNIDENFIKGFTISGLTQNPNPTIYLLVEWSNKDQSIVSREFIKVKVSNGETNE